MNRLIEVRRIVMKTTSASCWMLALAAMALAGATWAESAVEWTHTLATDATDGSTLVGGFATEETGGCIPVQRAYIARQAADGSELWRTAIPPAEGLDDLDSQHVMATTVHDATIDPQTGEIFATAEMLTTWQGATCPAGVASAIGTSVLRLAPDGTVLGDTYLGKRPAGLPTAAFGCDQRCAPDRLPQIIGRSVTIETDGLIQISGGRRGPRHSSTGLDTFVANLPSHLGPLPNPDLTFFDGGTSGDTLNFFCTIAAESHLVSIKSLPDTTFTGNQSYLSSIDDCILKINYTGFDSGVQFPDYGIETEFNLPTTTTALLLTIDMQLPSYYHSPIVFQLKNRQPDRWVEIASFAPDANNKVKERVTASNPSSFIDAAGNLIMRVVFKYNTATPQYAESVDIDELEIEPQ